MQEPEVTPEEIKKRTQKMLKFYEERLPFIRVQHEYETKRMEVLEAQVRMIRADDFLFQYNEGKKKAEEDAKTGIKPDAHATTRHKD